MSAVKPAAGVTFDAQVPVLIVGAGAAGLCAALAATEAGVEPLVIERNGEAAFRLRHEVLGGLGGIETSRRLGNTELRGQLCRLGDEVNT